ncbi:MAG: GntR family transcriptional regulator, partial [Firmicutes bacterium]|nr:GntR family transcriptional regulator [Bacillota bacterium]
MATPLAAVERVRLDEQVYRALRRAIVRGELVPGQRLLQEELAGRLGT